jgi:transcriptional regulator with XRE-family HTH domain
MQDAQAEGTSDGLNTNEETEAAGSLAALGRAVRRHREQRDMSVEALARIASVEHQDVRAIETGELDPTYDVLVALAHALGVRTSSLIIDAQEGRACVGSLARGGEEHTRLLEARVFATLRAREHRDPYARAQLERRLAGANPLDLSDALRNLAEAGVINLGEERVTLSRAAIWTMRLATMVPERSSQP